MNFIGNENTKSLLFPLDLNLYEWIFTREWRCRWLLFRYLEEKEFKISFKIFWSLIQLFYLILVYNRFVKYVIVRPVKGQLFIEPSLSSCDRTLMKKRNYSHTFLLTKTLWLHTVTPWLVYCCAPLQQNWKSVIFKLVNTLNRFIQFFI